MCCKSVGYYTAIALLVSCNVYARNERLSVTTEYSYSVWNRILLGMQFKGSFLQKIME